MAGRGRSILQNLQKNLREASEAPPPAEQLDNLHLDESGKFEEAVGGELLVASSSETSSKLDLDSLIEKSPGSVASSFLSCARGRGVVNRLLNLRPKPSSDESQSQSQPSAQKASEAIKSSSLGIAGRGRGIAAVKSDSSGTPKFNSSDTASSNVQPTSNGSSSQKLKIGESESKTGTSSLTQYSFKQPAAPKATGCKGRPLTTVSNCIKIECDPNKGVFEYEVLFNPSVGDSVQANRKCLNQGKELFGEVRIFDGKVLRLPHRLTEQQSKFKATTEAGLETEVTLKFQKQIRISQCIPLYNMLFDKVFRILEYIRDGKKVFNPRDPPIIPQHKLELWPGYVKSVDELDGGLMLTMDVSHKVLATTTVYDKIREMSRSSNTSWKDNLRKQMITRIVVTKYNNKSYRIDDFDFARSPLTTFEVKGRTMSIKDYYQEQYCITIKDEKQPMIVCRKEMRLAGQEAQEMEILLVPEICFLTGLGDEQRRDFRLMKDMSSFTKMSPPQRIAAYKRFIDNLYDSEKALQVLADWGLKLDRDTAKAPARVLDDQKIIFGGNKEFSAGPKADFTRHAISNEVLLAFDIEDWVIIVSKGSENCAKTFEEKAAEFAKPSGIRVKKSKTIIIPDAKTTTYCTAIREALNDNKNIQIVVIIFPTLQEDRYAAVKKILCSEIPTPSQVIQTKSLNQPGDKLRSIVIKIVLQMNCKLGGALWGIKIPLKKTMIIGIDTYHELGAQSINVGGFVASVNQGFTKYYSNPTIQQKKEELISGLALSMESALKFYYIDNNTYPDSIILFRDGVSDGQLENTLNFEIGQFRSAFTRIDPEYKPKLTFIVVQKRVNSKFYKEIDALQNKYENLPPGTVIDSGVTHKTFYDYYVVSQHVTQGATTPSHYICLLNENEFSADVLQLLTYKLCFMYYNWCGTVRVPAPCQYAHKLADLVGKNVRGPIPNSLRDKLFFL